jgi:hypothetical protein
MEVGSKERPRRHLIRDSFEDVAPGKSEEAVAINGGDWFVLRIETVKTSSTER